VRKTKTVHLYTAKTHLSRLVEEAAAGSEIIIAKAGKARARLVPLETTKTPRRPGGWEGRIIAQALVEGLTIVTHDQRFEPYGVPVIWV
jgi:prevent-host-death family protein